MVQQVVTRSQRRIERKQLVLIVLLIIAVSGVSFALGVMFGQQRRSLSEPVAGSEPANLPTVAKVVPPPKPEPASEKPEQLTFYENLPKGNSAPLGSGINLPPDNGGPTPAAKKQEAVAAAAPKPIAAKKAPSPSEIPTGPFIVQVASFRSGEEAGKLAVRLEQYRLKTFVESVDLGTKGIWHRVLAGPFPDREQAEKAVALLREKERYSALVRQR